MAPPPPPSLRPEPLRSLYRYLLLASLLRLPAVVFADGYDFVDQQYQYVDPAWHLATGRAWHATWEWVDGIRSWVYPGLLAGVFRLLLALGVDEPAEMLRGARGVHAVLSLLPLWLFWLLVMRWRPLARPRGPLLLVAASGLLVAGVQPSGPALAVTLATAAAIAVQGPRWFPLLGGLCLGLAFCCRFQEALFGPPLLAVLLWQRRLAAAAVFAAGCVPGIVLQGVVDVAAGGPFLVTPWRYLYSNVALGSAEKWHTQPFWFYFVAGVVPVLALVPPFVRVAWQRFASGAALLPAAAAGALVHLLAHSFLARKALRFEYPALAMMLVTIAVGVAGRRPLERWHWRALVAVHLGLFAWASLWRGNAGAVDLAIWLRSQPARHDELLVVDGDATALGGFFHFRPQADRVRAVARADLAAELGRPGQPPGGLIVAVRDALAPEVVAAGGLEPVAEFRGCLDLRRGDRRFVYRRRA